MGEISLKAARRLPVGEYVAFDLETTGLSPETDEVLEVAMVRFAGGQPVERWSSLVNPGMPVPLKTLRLTHIDPDELSTSPCMADLLDRIEAFRGDLPLVGHNSGFDSAFLAKYIQGFPGVPLYDTLELARIVVPGFSSYKLTDLAQSMGVAVSEAHRAYDDAEVSGVIFRLVQEAMEEMSRVCRESIRHLMGAGWVAAHMLEEDSAQPLLFDEPGQTLLAPRHVVAPPVRQSKRLPLTGTPLEASILQALQLANGTIALGVTETLDSARAIAQAAHLAGSAGKRILLAGFPAESLPDGAVLAGAPQDYACFARLEEARRQARSRSYSSLDPEHRRFLASVFRWAEVTRDGVLAGLQWGSAGHEVVPEISCPATMACAASCPSKNRCFYLISRAGSEAGVLGYATSAQCFGLQDTYDAVLIWGSGSLGRTWQSSEYRLDLSSLKENLRRDGALPLVPSLDALMASAGADLSRAGVMSPETASAACKVAGELVAASKSLRAERGGSAPGGYPVDPPLLWKGLHAAEKAAAALSDLRGPAGAGSALIVEQNYGDESQRGAVLVRRAVWPTKAAVSALLQRAPRVILLSDVAATAVKSAGGRRFLGLDDESASCSGQVLPGMSADGAGVTFAVLDGGRMVSPQEYPSYLADFIVPLAHEVRTGLLVAFPSRSLLKDTYALVQPVLESQSIALYGQGIDGGRRVVEHLSDGDSVVFAIAGNGPTEGEPVPQCLLLTRVPFAPPNPLDEARRGQVSSAAGGFVEVSVRPAALALRSYVEKMLAAGGPRHVVVADPKVLPRRSNWGTEFMADFSDLPRVVGPAAEVLSRLRR